MGEHGTSISSSFNCVTKLTNFFLKNPLPVKKNLAQATDHHRFSHPRVESTHLGSLFLSELSLLFEILVQLPLAGILQHYVDAQLVLEVRVETQDVGVFEM